MKLQLYEANKAHKEAYQLLKFKNNMRKLILKKHGASIYMLSKILASLRYQSYDATMLTCYEHSIELPYLRVSLVLSLKRLELSRLLY
jgi:hypothetical protein